MSAMQRVLSSQTSENALFYSPQGSHGDNSVPKRGWNGIKGCLLDILFTVEHDGGEDDDGHGEAEHQEAELGGAALEGVSEYPESLGMSGELENAEHAKHSKGDKGAADLTVIGHQEPDVVGHDGHEVNHRHHRPCELPPEDARNSIS